MAISRITCSGSTNGRPKKVTSTTSGAADLIHTAQSGTAAVDQVTLYAANSGTAAVLLTLMCGGSSADDEIKVPIPGQQGLVLVLDGLTLNGAVAVKAYAATANVITLAGYVDRFS